MQKRIDIVNPFSDFALVVYVVSLVVHFYSPHEFVFFLVSDYRNNTYMSKLFVVATPIGNLQDITLRALEIFNGVDWIAAEDTRVTKKLLSRFKIDKPIISCHKHSDRRSIVRIISLLRAGKNVAFVTDAGTPGISDPGQYLIKSVVGAGFATGIVSIPGPSALSAAISISDVDCSEFLFLGFPPHKKGRKKFFARVVLSPALT